MAHEQISDISIPSQRRLEYDSELARYRLIRGPGGGICEIFILARDVAIPSQLLVPAPWKRGLRSGIVAASSRTVTKRLGARS